MIFRTQSLLTITLDTEYDISSATDLFILYTNPNGETGEWNGTLNSATKIDYEVQAGDIDIAGEWSFMAKAIIGGKDIYGTLAKENIEDIIEVTP